MRAAHRDMVAVAMRLFAVEDLFRIGFARFGLGHDYTTVLGEDLYSSSRYLIEGELPSPCYADRILRFGLEYAEALKARGLDENAIPIIVAAHPLDHWGKVDSWCSLDLNTMVGEWEGGSHTFAENGSLSDADIALWLKHFWNPAEQGGFELRLESRLRV